MCLDDLMGRGPAGAGAAGVQDSIRSIAGSLKALLQQLKVRPQGALPEWWWRCVRLRVSVCACAGVCVCVCVGSVPWLLCVV